MAILFVVFIALYLVAAAHHTGMHISSEHSIVDPNVPIDPSNVTIKT
jgi:hypothetical protein